LEPDKCDPVWPVSLSSQFRLTPATTTKQQHTLSYSAS